jgi:Ca2+-binding EF-hand superfamily protein
MEQHSRLFKDPTDEQVARAFAVYDVEGTGSISTGEVAGRQKRTCNCQSGQDTILTESWQTNTIVGPPRQMSAC